MLFSITLALLLHSTPAAACWVECPEGKECYFEEVWLSEAELQKMAEANCPGSDGHALHLSTGMTVEFHCSPEGKVAKQTAPDLEMKIKGEEEAGKAKKFRSDCSGQEDCLAADRENKKLFDEMKAQKAASNTLPLSP